jgi:D-3-phosphoglycerate dehydrogenase / 2-oxoglutarate reductase
MSGGPREVALTTTAAEHFRAELEQLPGVRLRERYELAESADERALIGGLAGAWAVIAGSERYSRGVLERLPGLRAIARWGTGSDAIDIEAATDAGVAVVTTPGANAQAVADMALALMLASLRRLPELDASVRAGRWRSSLIAGDLAEATVGVIGLGAIGRAVVCRLGGFGCRVLAFEPDPDPEFVAEHEVTLLALEELLPRVDVLTLHAPLTEATHHLVGARELALLPSHAVLVNTSRGPLIEETALVAALREGQIAAAGLDVFEHEPLAGDEPITQLPNVILSGHVSSSTRLGFRRTGEAIFANLSELLAGRLPASCKNPEAWAGTGATDEPGPPRAPL